MTTPELSRRGACRRADVPRAVALLGESLTKADLLEIAWCFAIALHGEERERVRCLATLVHEANAWRAQQGRGPLRLSKFVTGDAADELRAAIVAAENWSDQPDEDDGGPPR